MPEKKQSRVVITVAPSRRKGLTKPQGWHVMHSRRVVSHWKTKGVAVRIARVTVKQLHHYGTPCQFVVLRSDGTVQTDRSFG